MQAIMGDEPETHRGGAKRRSRRNPFDRTSIAVGPTVVTAHSWGGALDGHGAAKF